MAELIDGATLACWNPRDDKGNRLRDSHDWTQVKGRSRLSWAEARVATRAAWERVACEPHPR